MTYIYIYIYDISSLRVNTSAHCSGRKQVKGLRVKVTNTWTRVFCDVICSGSWAVLVVGVELGILVD